MINAIILILLGFIVLLGLGMVILWTTIKPLYVTRPAARPQRRRRLLGGGYMQMQYPDGTYTGNGVLTVKTGLVLDRKESQMTEQSKGYPVDYWSWVEQEDVDEGGGIRQNVAITGHCENGLKVTLTLPNADKALSVFSVLQRGCRFDAIFPPPDIPTEKERDRIWGKGQ